MAKQVTARFYVDEVKKKAFDPKQAALVLKPAYNNGSGNEAWAKATPSGRIELQISNPDAVAFFNDAMDGGQDLHLTFELVADLES